jgi:uncharacterized surface protein with fasciclin (FAS1) repeats
MMMPDRKNILTRFPTAILIALVLALAAVPAHAQWWPFDKSKDAAAQKPAAPATPPAPPATKETKPTPKAAKPAAKPEKQSTPKPAAKPIAKPEPKPTPKPEIKPAPKPEVKPEVKPADVKAPEAKAPEVKAPEVKAPEVKAEEKPAAPVVAPPATPAAKPEVKAETKPVIPAPMPPGFDKDAIAKKQQEQAAKAKAEQEAFAKIEKEKAEKAKADADKKLEDQKKKDAITLAGHLEAKGKFKTLLDLFAISGFSTLKSPGNFTIFAPTDEAFAKFTAYKVEDLKKRENIDTLRAILGYHLLNGNFLLKNVKDKAAPNAMQGDILPIKVGDAVMVGNARVIDSDGGPGNGTIYVIDTVLVPPSLLKKK